MRTGHRVTAPVTYLNWTCMAFWHQKGMIDLHFEEFRQFAGQSLVETCCCLWQLNAALLLKHPQDQTLHIWSSQGGGAGGTRRDSTIKGYIVKVHIKLNGQCIGNVGRYVQSVSINMLTRATYFSVVQVSLWGRKRPAVVRTNRRLRSPPQKKHCHLFRMHAFLRTRKQTHSRVLEVAHTCAKREQSSLSESPVSYVIDQTQRLCRHLLAVWVHSREKYFIFISCKCIGNTNIRYR